MNSRKPAAVELKPSQPKAFGLLFSAIFASVGLYLAWHSSDFYPLFFILSALFLTVAIVKPSLLKKITFLWLVLGLKISKITNPIIIGSIYFTLLLPIAFILRLVRVDNLKLKRDDVSASYWQPVDPEETKLNRF